MPIPTFPILLLISYLLLGTPASAAVFTLHNNCASTIWAATISSNTPPQDFDPALLPTQTLTLTRPRGFSGRFWARTNCTFSSGAGKCATGDCNSQLNCIAGGEPPVTLAEFTLASDDSGKDFYDVSLVDGYNIQMSVTATASSGSGSDCLPAGCVADLNGICPAELRVRDGGEVIACRSACAAFGTAEFCCTEDHGTPATCPPTRYSAVFKTACPTAYSYAYDDETSTRTCRGSDYVITFCPQGSGSI